MIDATQRDRGEGRRAAGGLGAEAAEPAQPPGPGAGTGREAEVAAVRDRWSRLGLPGLVDLHVHFLPPRVLAKVWAFFDALRAPDGSSAWPVRYRGSDAERLALLRDFGVRAFPTLCYPHKPGMAEWLNDWAAGFAREAGPDVVRSATLYPEPGVGDYLARALDDGARVVKVHVRVGAFDPRDPLLDPAWGLLAEAGTPVVVHAGSGPKGGPTTGPRPFGEVLARHPRLLAVVAHMGDTEYGDFVALAERYPRVHLDTTMAFTDFTERRNPYPRELLPRLADLGDRVVLGSDFPNIPYPYAHQLEALERLRLGDDWLRAVWHDNGARLLGL